MKLDYDEKRSFIIGMLLGDGHTRIGKNAINYNLLCTHNPKQYDYMIWKMEILKENLSKNYWISENVSRFAGKAQFAGNKDKLYKIFSACLGSDSLVTSIRKEMYEKNIKKISVNILNQVSPLGIAIWYMDDGNLAYKKNKDGSICSREISLHIQGFDYDSQLNVVEFFKNSFDIDSRLHKSRNKYKLWMNTTNSLKFLKLVCPYVNMIDCMKYKTDLKYNENNKRAILFGE